MKDRTLGRTGVKVSEIGLGGHREGVESRSGVARTARFFLSTQERARAVGAAIDAGVTYFDTTYGCETASLGQSLKLLDRDGLFVSGMRVDFFANWLAEGGDIRAYTRREVEACVREFGFPAVDQFMLGAMEQGDPLAHPRSAMEDALDELGRLRDKGLIRFIGFSCHSSDYAARLLEAFPAFDTVMVPYNFVNRSAEGRLAAALQSTGAAWVAMKALVWHVYGLPVTVLRNLRPAPGRLAIDPSAAIAKLALRFILANPLVCSAVAAANTVEAARENTSASPAAQLTERDHATLAAYAGAMIAEDFVPLAIGGLLEDNLRVRANAFGLIRGKLGWDVPGIDWEAEDAPQQARRLAEGLLSRLKGDGRWAELIG